MNHGCETPEMIQACREADQRIREWMKKSGADPAMAYSDTQCLTFPLGGYPAALVIDKIIQRMAWA